MHRTRALIACWSGCGLAGTEGSETTSQLVRVNRTCSPLGLVREALRIAGQPRPSATRVTATLPTSLVQRRGVPASTGSVGTVRKSDSRSNWPKASCAMSISPHYSSPPIDAPPPRKSFCLRLCGHVVARPLCGGRWTGLGLVDRLGSRLEVDGTGGGWGSSPAVQTVSRGKRPSTIAKIA